MDRVKIIIGVLVIALLAVATIRRNEVWRDPLRLWQDASDKAPHKIRPLVNLAKLRDIRGDRGEAIRLLSVAAALPVVTESDRRQRGQARTDMAMLFIQSGQLMDALNILNSVLLEAPNMDALHAMAILAVAGGNPRIAMDLTDHILQVDGSWHLRPSWHATRGQALEALGRCTDAMREYREVKRLLPEFAIPACKEG